MKINHKIKIVILILILMTFFSGSPEDKSIRVISFENREFVSLYELVKTLDISNSYDIVSGRGKLYYKSSFAVYQSGYSIILIDGRIAKSEYPVAVREGELLLPVSLFLEIVKSFYADRRALRSGDSFNVTSGEAEHAPEKTEEKIVKKENDYIKNNDGDRITFIIIDPGHGGKDPGAVAKGGVKEKKITLEISLKLEKFLKEKIKNIKIHMTRRGDRFIELSRRTDIANRMLKAGSNGLFISVHVNASIVKSISGFETYFLSQNPSNEDARTTAALENNVVILEDNSNRKSYGDVDHIQALMLTTQIQKESLMLASSIQESIDRAIWESKSGGVKKADFFVLRGALLPAVLVEVGFISNSRELGNLKKQNYQKKIAEGIGNGIISFIEKYNKNIK
ncbi:MAG: N-acetylmuramoyl-L-alanine amidase [Spirochaetes bacterium]|nr:N-acetylmuramoyl-L-alanine amidase [Spirochaetota bacterium]